MCAGLLAVESDAATTDEYVARIDAVLKDANADEAKELQQDREAVEVSRKVLQQDLARGRAQLAQIDGGTELLQHISSMLSELSRGMAEIREQVTAHDASLAALTVGELQCPRLFVILPDRGPTSRLERLVRRGVDSIVRDKYRLFFLDPLTGCATPCGVDGRGYHLSLVNKWLVQHKQQIDLGLRVVKAVASVGRLVGLLPLDMLEGMPTEIVKQSEVQAVLGFEALMRDAEQVGSAQARSERHATKAATGRAYKELHRLLEEQCGDKHLMHCQMQKVRQNTFESVHPVL